LGVYMALLRVCSACFSVSRALRKSRGFGNLQDAAWSTATALSRHAALPVCMCRALLSISRALLSISRALLSVHRALLRVCSAF